YDNYAPEVLRQAIHDLGQDPDAELQCVYCGEPAATWDHVNNNVVRSEFSGYGNRIRNLVPCCRTCNERKGSRPWEEWLDKRDASDKEQRRENIRRFLDVPSAQPVTALEMAKRAPDAMRRYLEIRDEVFRLLKEADEMASIIRAAHRG
ncbi:MAG: HNH endonuclease, partial [Pararhizobium sp.]